MEILFITEGREAAKSGRAAAIRRSARLSQADVARELGVTTSAVCKWERGDRVPRAAVAAKYAQLLRQLADVAEAWP